MFPRSSSEIRQFAEDGELFGVRDLNTGALAGLIYSTLDCRKTRAQWEIGGLTVAAAYKGVGIGSALVSFALAHTLTLQLPWENGQRITAHIHESNASPRNIFDRLAFRFVQRVVLTGSEAPASMKRNADGNVEGDELQFERDGLPALLENLEWASTGRLRNGDGIFVDPGIETINLELMLAALRQL
jgi:GNAT superfamily N-acetyltransferase